MTNVNQDKPTKRSHWGQARRLEFIDVRLRWDGRLNRADLTGFFGISVPQASIDLARYMEAAPQNLHYDGTSKSYAPTPAFEPAFASGDPHRYLNDLLGLRLGVLQDDQVFLGWKPSFDTVPMLERRLESRTFFTVTHAIRRPSAVQISYQSMRDDTAERRVVSPHALAFDGFRWHVRAYCHLRKDYRDFVLARVCEAVVSEEPPVSGDLDVQWHQVLQLVLAPNPRLAEGHRRAIARDYGMEGGGISYACRRSLLYYALRRFGLAKRAAEDSKEQQLVLANRSELQEYLAEVGAS